MAKPNIIDRLDTNKITITTKANKTGDTFTGNLTMSSGVTAWDIGYASAGAVLALRNENHTDAGAFALVAKDGSNAKTLYGHPSGTLTWDGSAVLNATSSLDMTNATGVLPIANGGTGSTSGVLPTIAAAVWSEGLSIIRAPASGTWWCFGEVFLASGTEYINGSYAGGAAILNSSEVINAVKHVMCIKIA